MKETKSESKLDEELRDKVFSFVAGNLPSYLTLDHHYSDGMDCIWERAISPKLRGGLYKIIDFFRQKPYAYINVHNSTGIRIFVRDEHLKFIRVLAKTIEKRFPKISMEIIRE